MSRPLVIRKRLRPVFPFVMISVLLVLPLRTTASAGQDYIVLTGGSAEILSARKVPVFGAEYRFKENLRGIQPYVLYGWATDGGTYAGAGLLYLFHPVAALARDGQLLPRLLPPPPHCARPRPPAGIFFQSRTLNQNLPRALAGSELWSCFQWRSKPGQQPRLRNMASGLCQSFALNGSSRIRRFRCITGRYLPIQGSGASGCSNIMHQFWASLITQSYQAVNNKVTPREPESAMVG